MFYLLKRFTQMKILLNNKDLNEALNNVSKLGFVPTMGSLHKGHLSLIKKSKQECEKTIVSIFVNPYQFNNKNDFKKYPRNIDKDLAILKRAKIDFLYLPNKNQIYNTKRKSKIKINKKDKILCAKYRRGHFEGVIDVMDRLTNIIKPNKIFMGEKDLQQLKLVKFFIEKKYKTKIVACKTIRDINGLALSSRNLLLNKRDLLKAKKITKNLFSFKKKIKKKKYIRKYLSLKKIELMNIFKINIEYLEIRNVKNFKISKNISNSRIFIAYYLNKIRLIDNI